MPCSCGFREAVDQLFNEQVAARDLAGYRKKGPGPTARLLVDGLTKAGTIEGVLLDIGSGIGALTFELLDRGLSRGIAVDASMAYVSAGREEAVRRGRADVTEFVHGDFLDLASRLPRARVVTLDRVICCYPDYEPLIEEALRHAERSFALSYPRDRWWVRTLIAAENAGRRLRGKSFRTYVHPAAQVEAIIDRAGFRAVSRRRTWVWSADVYLRST